jgi:glycosyltransferase involved in cell wall biosynthesis
MDGHIMKIAVITAAYNAEKYIMEFVRSIREQILAADCTLDIRIGVDGCRETSAMLSRHKVPHYWSPKNHGAYLIRNALMYLRPADIYAYFDADDVMMPDYIRQNVALIRMGADAVMTGKLQCDAKLRPKPGQPAKVESGGAITFTQKALDAVGGFYRHRCAGDTDFMMRLEMAGFPIKKSHAPSYYRRLHGASLTRSGLTVYGGEYRKQVWAEMTANRERGIIKMKPTIIKLEKR